MELSKPQRLISILILLAQRRGNVVTIREIQDHLERNSDESVNIRALQRDMSDLLNIPNIPVQVQGNMRTGYEYFISSPGFSRALAAPFTANEAMAGYVIKRISPYVKGTALEKHFNKLLEKVEDTMADTVFEDLDQTKTSALDNIDFIPFGVYDIGEKSDIFDDLISAISKKRKVRLTYRAQKKANTYTYRPLKILLVKSVPYLLARQDWCERVITLRIDKMEGVKVKDWPFEIETSDYAQIKEITQGSIGIFHTKGQKPRKVVLVFESWLKDRIQNRFWHGSQEFKERKDGKLEMVLHVVVNEELISWIFYWQEWVYVKGPASLKREVKERAARIMKLY